MTLQLKPGDVLAVRGSSYWVNWWIRFGAALRGLPNLDAHVAIMHHYDSGGVPWGLEGKPGGVGWRDLRDYLKNPYTVTNVDQPGRADKDRASVAHDAEAMLGTAYDWQAILGDGFQDIHIDLWNPQWAPATRPGHVVCSSFAAYLYAKYGWKHPRLNQERYCQPGDWDQFIIDNHYQ
jgi:hypothetical protein